MLQPKRVRYRRPQDGRGNKGNAHRGTQLAFGSFGIKTLDAKWIDSRQIEAARVAINRYMNREGQVWIRIFPDSSPSSQFLHHGAKYTILAAHETVSEKGYAS